VKYRPENVFLEQNVAHHYMDYGLDDRGFESRWGLGIFILTTASRPDLGPAQSPIQWVPGAVSLGVKRPGREADHLSPSSAEAKNEWSYKSTPPIRLHDVMYILCTDQRREDDKWKRKRPRTSKGDEEELRDSFLTW
jgi:hypothetical protein